MNGIHRNNFITLVIATIDHIDLDPCSNIADNKNVLADTHYTIDDDGLSVSWHGRIFMNPPYGRAIGDWVHKLVTEYRKCNVLEAIALVPSRTDTAWFRKLRDYPRCFINGRMKFGNNDNSAPFPSMAVYLGSNEQTFIQHFSKLGDIYKRIN